jgi:uncharacterized spore protein YtfJ
MDLSEVLARADKTMSVGRTFGPAYEKDDTLVIPVAWVVGGAGGGKGTQSEPKPGEGEGSGFGVVAWPLGVYVVKGGDVRWVPAIDATRLMLAGAALLRGALRLRGRRALRRG